MPGITFQTFTENIAKRLQRNTERIRYWTWESSHSRDNLSDRPYGLDDLAIELWSNRNSIKVIFSYNSGYVYSNDLLLLQTITEKKYAYSRSLTEAVVDRSKNTVQLIKSDYAMRSYFKEKRLDSDQKKQLHDFLKSQTDVKITNSMTYWFARPDRFWTRSYFFIDHNSQLTITMLGLLHSGLIHKTLPIVLKDK